MVINVITKEELNEAFTVIKDGKISAIDVPMTKDLKILAESFIDPQSSLWAIIMNSISIGMQFGLIVAEQRKKKDELTKLEELHAKS